MATLANREAYFETGLDVLADLGYGGLKLAEVCNRLGVTTGSFYHYFASWPAYRRELITFWVQDRTVRMAQAFSAVSDPRERDAGDHPGGAVTATRRQAAIRAWVRWTPTSTRCRSR